MRNPSLLLICLLISGIILSQPTQIRIKQYAIPQTNGADKILVLKMSYAGYHIDAFIGDTAALKQAGQVMIDVVCTDYPTEQSLATLNANRVKEFFKTFPFIKSQVSQVNYFRQKRGDEKETALPMFHGIVVRYRVTQTKELMKLEWKKLEELLSINQSKELKPSLREEELLPVPYPISGKKSPADPSNNKPDYYDPSMNLRGKQITFIIGDSSFLNNKFNMPKDVPVLDFRKALKNDLITKRVYQQFKDRRFSYITLYVPLAEEPPAEKTVIKKEIYMPPPKLPDSTIIKVLKRNSWKHAVLVADVTGSMHPYTAQFLLWLQLHSTDSLSKRFVFFNDGDEKDDDKKRIGKTGGIYLKECNSYEETKALAQKAMLNGSGGDFPENNIEAILTAQKEFSDAKEIILIADNWAPIRDKELINKINMPVRVILCGVTNGNVSADYVNLARKTKGSLHLIEKDIIDLASLQEGDTVTVGNKKFRLKDGELKEADITKENQP